MSPPKRRKTYLDPGSSSHVPKATKWRLEKTASADPAVDATGIPSPAARKEPLRSEPNKKLDEKPSSSAFSDSEHDEPEPANNADPAVDETSCERSPAARRDPLRSEPSKGLDEKPSSSAFSDSEHDESEPANNADPAVDATGCVPSPAAQGEPLCSEPNKELDEEPSSSAFSDLVHYEFEPANEHNEPLSDMEHHEPSEVDEDMPQASLLPQHDHPSSVAPIFDTTALAQPFTDDSPFTHGDAYMMLLDVAIKNGFSWAAVEDVQKLFNRLVGEKAFPESKYLLKKLCGVDLNDILFHFYCDECMTLLAKTSGSLVERQQLRAQCDTCHKVYVGRELVRAGSFFVGLPLKKQLASLLASKTVSEAVVNALEKVARNDDGCTMSDITDGHQYRAMRAQAGMSSNDLTLTLNSDGSPVFNSSNYSIWPVQVTLNELPPKLRWTNVMVPLLWYGKQHPDMTLLLQAFVDQLENLNASGVTWTYKNGLISSKVFCICCCADAPARAAMQQMMQYNGYFGCAWCYHPGINIEGTIKYCLSEPFPDRTDEEAVHDMRTACNERRPVRGVKGPTPLINLPGFSAVWSWCPDYMHCILLGVARQITELWFSKSGSEYYIGEASVMAAVSERLCSIQMPECINRQPRSLLTRKHWKAAEWQNWLLYYSIPCISGVLDRTYLDHWSLLVAGVFLLLKDAVTEAEVAESTKLLTEFVVGVQFLYGNSEMTYNVHQLLHMPKSVLLFGPLWAHSCFTFETSIGRLLKLVTSSNGVALQIATRLLLYTSFSALKALASDHALSLLGMPNKQHNDKLIPLGKPEAVEEALVSEHVQLQGRETVEFRRIKLNGAIVCSEKYDRQLRIDNTAVKLRDGTYAKIQRIFCCTEPTGEKRFFVLTGAYRTDRVQPCLQHIKVARRTQRKSICEIDDHARPCVYHSLAGKEYFCDLVNKYEWS